MPRETKPHTLYRCGICECLHPWEWNGDCREDDYRYGDTQDYAEKHVVHERDIDVLGWGDRLEEDGYPKEAVFAARKAMGEISMFDGEE